MNSSDDSHDSTTDAIHSARRNIAFECAILAGVFALTACLHYVVSPPTDKATVIKEDAPYPWQTVVNVVAVEEPTLRKAIVGYPKCWPPVYPASLWIFARLGLPIMLFNIICFWVVLSVAWIFARRYFCNITAILVPCFIAATHANYGNLVQITSEALLLPQVALTLYCLASYKERPSIRTACVLGVLSAMAALTRFFSVFWLPPVILLHLAILCPVTSWRRRIGHVGVYVAPIVLSVLPWLLYVHSRTGSFSGMDRLASREMPPSIARLADLVGYRTSELTLFTTNVVFTIKSLFIDLFSPVRMAWREAVLPPGLTVSEVAVACVLLVALVLIVGGALRSLRHLVPSSRRLLLNGMLRNPAFLPLHFAAVYVFSLVTVWSFTNNDPIYTRYLLPVYPFGIMAAFAFFSLMKTGRNNPMLSVPVYALGMLYLGTNLAHLRYLAPLLAP